MQALFGLVIYPRGGQRKILHGISPCKAVGLRRKSFSIFIQNVGLQGDQSCRPPRSSIRGWRGTLVDLVSFGGSGGFAVSVSPGESELFSSISFFLPLSLPFPAQFTSLSPHDTFFSPSPKWPQVLLLDSRMVGIYRSPPHTPHPSGPGPWQGRRGLISSGWHSA